MKFEIGDKIALKDSGKEGRILSYPQNDIAEVRLSDGTIIDVSDENLEYPYLNMFRKESRKKQEKTIKKYHETKDPFAKEKQVERGILLGFWVEYFSDDFDDLIDSIKIYFNNETEDELEFYYNFTSKFDKGFDLRKSIQPFESIYLHSISLDTLNDNPKFTLQLAPKGEELTDVPIHLKSKFLFDQLNQLSNQNLPAYYHKIADNIYEVHVALKPIDNIENILNSKPRISGQTAKKLPSDTIDLHIDQLRPDDWNTIAPKDVLDVQMSAFADFLAEAIQNKTNKITIIHGIGTGTLRDRVHKVLDYNTFVKKYENELNPNYGYGATDVWLK